MRIKGGILAIGITALGAMTLAAPIGALGAGATSASGATTAVAAARAAFAAAGSAASSATRTSGGRAAQVVTASGRTSSASSGPAAGSQADHNFGSSTMGCGGDLSVTATPTTLWPPNHKMVPVTFSLTESPADSDGGTLSIQIMDITTNQVDEDGAGQPTLQQGPDWSPSAPGTAQTATEPGPATVTEMFRAERNGVDPLKSGRQYMVTVACKETLALVTETMGSATFTITVPHDHSDF